jgi:hypothetical protein
MAEALRIGVGLCAGWALLALSVQVLRARAYGTRPIYARPAGDPGKAVLYAFGPGMSPTAKESVREHLPAYFAGMGYHLGIFASLAWLALIILGGAPGGPILTFGRVLSALGAGCGLILLGRRILDRRLRGLSSPDDYLANALTTALATLVLISTFAPAAQPVLMVAGMALLLYVPVGKIRHCFFFFTTRAAMAAAFGRRGTLPPAHSHGRG